MPTLIPFASLRAMPWKNGGGSTTEIIISPPNAALDTFDWRISMATIAGDGPFSIFPGIDRTLSLVSGQGVDLQMEGPAGEKPVVALRAANPALGFPGEWRIHATLPGGVTQDFNVMTRRSTVRHEFARLSDCSRYARKAPVTLLFLVSAAPVQWRSATATFSLQQYDTVLLQENDDCECEWQTLLHTTLPAGLAGQSQAGLQALAPAQPEWFVVELFPASSNAGQTTGAQNELG